MDGEFLSQGTSMNLDSPHFDVDKDSVVYVIPLQGSECLLAAQHEKSIPPTDDPMLISVDETTLNLLSTGTNVDLPSVIIVDEAKAKQEQEDKERERSLRAAKMMKDFTELNKKRQSQKSSPKTFPQGEIVCDSFKCPVCSAVFSKSNAFFGHLQTHSGKGILFKCKTCPESFDSLANYWKHEKIHLCYRPFVCRKCNMTFAKQSQLSSHVQRNHEQKRSFQCHLCTKSFFKNSDLQQHLRVHEGIKCYQCKDCSRSFNHISNLNRHQRTHTGEKPYVCRTCSKRFTQQSSLIAHLATHSSTGRRMKTSVFKCPKCDRVFRSEGVFKVHLEMKHSKATIHSKSFYCQVCGETFAFVSELKNHFFERHKDFGFPCALCRQSFSSVQNLLRHECKHTTAADRESGVDSKEKDTPQDIPQPLNISGSSQSEPLITVDTSRCDVTLDQNCDVPKILAPRFHCNVCDKKFLRKDSLKQHQGIHSDDLATFQCDDCDEKFAWRSTLKKHRIKAHQSEAWPSVGCEMCERTFKSSNQKKMHVERDHFKIRSFICEVCSKAFYLKADLISHKRTHTKDKPYTCRHCDKAFSHVSHKIRHETTHKVSGPVFLCDLCKERFREKSDIESHFKKFHSDLDTGLITSLMAN